MIYQSQKMKLEAVRIVQQNEINDIIICRDINSAAKGLYTLLVIKDHRIARLYLDIFEYAAPGARDSYIESFSSGNSLCMVFEYKQERPLHTFYMGTAYSAEYCEKVCNNVLIACMASKLPYPLLYLVLSQKQLHLSEDSTVFIGYQLDLRELNAERNERDCVVKCAEILLELLRPIASQKHISYQLLGKKRIRKSYEHFAELYKDIQLTEVPKNRRGLMQKIKTWFNQRNSVLFKILLIICVILLIFMIASIVSQIIFGDVPWLRLLFNGFKFIGTESLLQ